MADVTRAGTQLGEADFDALARWLGDSLETVVPLHALITRRCSVWLDGPPASPRALVLLADYVRREPWAFGADAAAAVGMFLDIPDVDSLNVSLEAADATAAAMTRATARPTKRFEDLYFLPPGRIEPPGDGPTRILAPGDAPLLRVAAPDARAGPDPFVDVLLREGYCAAAIVDGRVVAQAHAYAVTPHHAEIGAKTSEPFRGRGLSTACGAALCARLQQTSRVPVWSTGETNVASQRVAEKIGMKLVRRRVYLSVA